MAKQQSRRKHLIRNILIGLASLPLLLALFIIVVVYVITPILETIDKSKFDNLADESHVLYDDIVRASGGQESWTYNKSCEPEYSGPWPTGVYYCTMRISTEVQVTAVEQFVTLHNKYYPVVDESPILSPTDNLKKAYPGDFGVRFVVSSAERHYNLSNDNSIDCTYLARLSQSNKDTEIGYGIAIKDGIGKVNIGLECTDKARKDWYN